MPFFQAPAQAVLPFFRSGAISLPTGRARAKLNNTNALPVSAPPPAPASWHRRPFTTSRALYRGGHNDGQGQNHYETLKVPHDASPADIKRSFYALSKKYHPDHNPNDPAAIRKFHALSEAYAIVGTPAKRATYDRDILRHPHHHHGAAVNAQRRGSYHSGQAGGRPASGLSRRRTPFRGPPPSYTRSGHWHEAGHSHGTTHQQGQQQQGQQQQHHHHHHRPPHDQEWAHPEASAASAGWTAAGGARAGMGPGQDPFGHILEGNLPHFNSVNHERSQRMQDRRRASRAAAAVAGMDAAVAAGESSVGMFFAVSGVVVLMMVLPFFFFGRSAPEKKGRKELEREAKMRK